MINKGDSVYIVFNNGKGVMDSQGKQYMYKSEKAFRKWFPCHHETAELIEYVPVRHGKWEQLEYFDEDTNTYICSVCDENWTLNAGNPKENSMNYCPSCGAKMDLEDMP